MLVLKDIKKNYGKFTALEQINLNFTPGVYGLLAPNGAGKTTLIKLITTLNFPAEGEILYDGCSITQLGSKYRDLLGYLPQNFGYYPHYTAKRFLSYLCALKGIDKKKTDEKVDQLLNLVGLDQVKNKKLKTFSGGMIQRVGIAQALLNDPKIVILDEPTAGLDPKERVRFRQLLSSLGKDRIVIISTHIVSDIESIAKEVVLIKNKTIFKVDSVMNINQALDNKVWTVMVNEEEAAQLEENYLMVNKNVLSSNVNVRIISDVKPHIQANLATPNLEDVFMFHYGQ